MSVLPSVLNQPAVPRRVVIAHLGNGASLCALREGKKRGDDDELFYPGRGSGSAHLSDDRA
ncbi:MAG: hypothetical protein ACREVJ_00280 [Gammaproteobacteria bacterium]